MLSLETDPAFLRVAALLLSNGLNYTTLKLIYLLFILTIGIRRRGHPIFQPLSWLGCILHSGADLPVKIGF